jgi:hypothetical protein
VLPHRIQSWRAQEMRLSDGSLKVTKRLFGCAFQPAFCQILNIFFAKIECGLYFLDRFDVLMLKMIFKK